jgi:hypothetical protein
VTLFDGKSLKAAAREGGELGPVLRSGGGAGTLVHHIGDDWSWRPGQSINMLYEFRNHVGLQVKLSTVKFQTVVIPKQDVEHWGVLERRSVPMARVYDRSSTIAGTLLFGPIGALVGASMDARAEQKKGEKPVIGVTYRVGDAEHAFFIEFPLAVLYRKAHEFLTASFPGLLRQ